MIPGEFPAMLFLDSTHILKDLMRLLYELQWVSIEPGERLVWRWYD
jgi:hypothetical protein